MSSKVSHLLIKGYKIFGAVQIHKINILVELIKDVLQRMQSNV